MVTYMTKGLSSIVGLLLILIALIIISSTIHNVLNFINEYSNINSMITNKQLLRSMVIQLTEGSYVYYPNKTLTINILNNIPEPLRIVGYVILFINISYEIIRCEEQCIIPPLTTSKFIINISEEPLGVFAVVLIRDEITHIVIKK